MSFCRGSFGGSGGKRGLLGEFLGRGPIRARVGRRREPVREKSKNGDQPKICLLLEGLQALEIDRYTHCLRRLLVGLRFLFVYLCWICASPFCLSKRS